MMSLRLLVLALIVSVASAANPIRRVVNMLQDMQKKIEAEGERDKKLFDKFMCYCTNGKVDLEKAVKDAETKIPATKARLQEAKSQKEQFESDLKKHKEAFGDAKDAIGEAMAIRSKEAKAFKTEYASKKTYIKAIKKAIKAILSGIDTSFLQTEDASVIRRLIVDADLKSADRDIMASFLSTGQEDAEAAPKSQQIVGILKAMLEDMKGDIKEMKKQEFGAKAAFSEMEGAKKKEAKMNSMSIEEKTARVGQLAVEIEELREDLEDTQASYEEDKVFLRDMDKTCDTKKDEWDVVQDPRGGVVGNLRDHQDPQRRRCAGFVQEDVAEHLALAGYRPGQGCKEASVARLGRRASRPRFPVGPHRSCHPRQEVQLRQGVDHDRPDAKAAQGGAGLGR